MVFIRQAALFVVVRFIARRVTQDYPIYLLNFMRSGMWRMKLILKFGWNLSILHVIIVLNIYRKELESAIAAIESLEEALAKA